MPLTQSQRSLLAKARVLGSGEHGLVLSDSECIYLCSVIATDLNLGAEFPELSLPPAAFFGPRLVVNASGSNAGEFERIVERLLELDDNADTYFACLANLYKRRLKYQRILRSQPIPTMSQVGPRGLLQFGDLSPQALAALLFWRKWFYDIDNRAAQETGYLFEPIIANAIGGTPVSAAQSPVKRAGDDSKGRQVDCVRGSRAYELKIRVTIAASGQGRWGEELQFPEDCRDSGFQPVLVVLDPTPNPKLSELIRAFEAAGGESYIGQAAWDHLADQAGATMSVFLRKYVRAPLESLLAHASDELPTLSVSLDGTSIVITVGSEQLSIIREPDDSTDSADSIPEGADEQGPGI